MKAKFVGLPGVIFDLDDTLYPERAYVLSGFQAVAGWAEKELGIPALEGFSQLRKIFDRGVRGRTFNYWLAELGYEDDTDRLVDNMISIYRDHSPILTPFEGVHELLASLKRTSKLGLVSDGPYGVQSSKWRALCLGQYFDEVLFTDLLGRKAWKPSPEPFETVLRALRLTPQGAVYVGDNPLKDFAGARQIGMGTIRIRCTGGIYESVEAPSPDYEAEWCVSDITELTKLLRKV